MTRLLLALLLMAATLIQASDKNDQAWPTTPVMRSAEPAAGKPGEIITVTGDYLDKTHVAEVYLTAGGVDLKAEIVSQSVKTLKFKIPAEAKPGRFCLMVLTAGNSPKFIEQPLNIQVAE
ncbi:MAG: IPT/TIG domain-containing protein [Acidobacteria bacterium]|nr:IPT/TIG domain-containing protein [Acidobacteriota bacterium]